MLFRLDLEGQLKGADHGAFIGSRGNVALFIVHGLAEAPVRVTAGFDFVPTGQLLYQRSSPAAPLQVSVLRMGTKQLPTCADQEVIAHTNRKETQAPLAGGVEGIGGQAQAVGPTLRFVAECTASKGLPMDRGEASLGGHPGCRIPNPKPSVQGGPKGIGRGTLCSKLGQLIEIDGGKEDLGRAAPSREGQMGSTGFVFHIANRQPGPGSG